MTDTEKAEYDDVVRQLVAKCEQLAAENTRLRNSENTAHSVLKEIYNDPAASPNVRVLAAKAAISHESAPLKPVPPPLDLVAEKHEPLADIVTRQRARMHRMWAEDPQFTGLRNSGYLPKSDGNDGDGQGGNSGDNTAS
jgi:hypothetical protein